MGCRRRVGKGKGKGKGRRERGEGSEDSGVCLDGRLECPSVVQMGLEANAESGRPRPPKDVIVTWHARFIAFPSRRLESN